MKNKLKIFFHPLEGSAPLSIYWCRGPYGDAIESKELNGVYFASPNGELLGVQFDDVDEGNDARLMPKGLHNCNDLVTTKEQKRPRPLTSSDTLDAYESKCKSASLSKRESVFPATELSSRTSR